MRLSPPQNNNPSFQNTNSSVPVLNILTNICENPSLFPLETDLATLNLPAQTNETLASLYTHLNERCANSEGEQHLRPKMAALTTEIRDCIIRRASTSQENFQELRALAEQNQLSSLIRDVTKTQDNLTSFKTLNSVFRNNVEAERSGEGSPRILHASVEYIKAKSGGVAAVAESLLNCQHQRGIRASMVTPYYGFYKTDPSFANAEFVGFIEHEYGSKSGPKESVKSSIYKIKNQGVVQYLVKSDPRFDSIFDIPENRFLYESLPHSDRWDRTLYLSSAIAAMASTYSGKSGTKSFNVLHIHDWHMGLAGRLVKEKYNPQRNNAALSNVGVLQHFHSSTFVTPDGHMSSKTCNRLGLAPTNEQYPITALDPAFDHVEVQRDGWLLGSDAVVHVSNFCANLATNPNTNMHELSANLRDRGGLHGVLNGISQIRFDITAPETYRELAISPENSISATPFLDGKKRTKDLLYREGVIADDTKPLYMYVGRMTSEKGINLLPSMVEQAVREGGQVVIMGGLMGNSMPWAVRKLLRLQKKHPNCVRIYTNIEDQTKLLGETGVSKGMLIRQATDFALIPSYRESCGLVGLEALAAGAMAVTSKVQGLGDFMIDSSKANFNAFTYSHGPTGAHSKTASRVKEFIKEFFFDILRKWRAKKAIRQAAHYHRSTTVAEREAAVKRIWESSQTYDWNNPGGAVDQLSNIYNQILSNRVRPVTNNDLQKIIKPSRWRLLVSRFRRFRQARSLKRQPV